MPRYFLKMAYDGTAYCGWQTQPNAMTVQEVTEKALCTLLRNEIRITGAGRTDTGVHARQFFAHFDADLPNHLPPVQLVYKLNRFLPNDIRIFEIREVNIDANARFDAISRSYQYFISTAKNPFLRPYAWVCPFVPDIEKMNVAATLLLETSDFTSFSKLHTQTFTNNCKVTEAFWRVDGETIIFKITADRFLRNMVRAIVGTLLEVGRDRIDLYEFQKIIDAKDRTHAGLSVPAHGLFLEEIQYPDSIFI